MPCLINITYAEDAERKRIEYTIGKWASEKKLRYMPGIIVKADTEDIDDFLKDLYARSSTKDIRVYKLTLRKFEIEPTREEIYIELEEDIKSVEKFMNYLMARQRAVFKDILSKHERLYETYTKKGTAKIRVLLKTADGKVQLKLGIEGYGGATRLLKEKIENEIKWYKRSKKSGNGRL